MIVRPERPADVRAIEVLLNTAFGQPAESQLVDALRQCGFMRLALVAESQGEIVGYILFSDLPIETCGGTVPALALAPMAVLPSMQRQGVGSRLVREGLRQALGEGHRIVIVLGHRHYYPRFGFSAELACPLASPYAGESFMALELVPGALAGVAGEVRYPPPFSAL
jgi:putative acetyltransferase